MKLSELKRIITSIPITQGDREVVVAVKMPYATVGPVPSVSVRSALVGFDWEQNMFILQPSETLTLADADFGAQFAELQKKYGWLDYENRNLKAEVKRLKKALKEDHE